MRPSEIGLPPKFTSFRRYPGFDQLGMATELALSDKRFDVANLSTGSGKSVTYCTAAILKGARYLVLTGTKSLESQLYDDGLVQGLIHSHRNYRCSSYRDDADDPEYRCSWPRAQCLHNKDVEAVLGAKGSVTNYAYWLAIARYGDPGLLGKFDYLVLDEAHQAPQWLTDSVAVTVTASRLSRVLGLTRPQVPHYPEIAQYESWLSVLLDSCHDRLSELDERTDRTEIRKVERLMADLEWVQRVPDALNSGRCKEPWIVIPQSEPGNPGVVFTPRWGSDFAELYLFRGIKSVLLTSATVTRDHARYLGIPDEQMRYREAPSPFDVRRRPVVWVPTTRVDFRMSAGSKYKLARQVDDIIEAAIEQGAGNGLLHTGSYDRNREIVQSLKYSAAVITHRQDSRDFTAQLERFIDKGRRGEFAVFASPRVQEGVNLPDDLARWQAIIKIPTPDRRDPLEKARLTDERYGERYGDLLIAEAVKQMCGRPVRSDSDFAVTFILDDHWKHYRWSCPFEEWFRAAFQVWEKPIREFQFLTREIVGKFGAMPPGIVTVQSPVRLLI